MKLFGSLEKKAEKYFLLNVARFNINTDKRSGLSIAGVQAKRSSTWSFEYLRTKKLFSAVYKFKMSCSFPIQKGIEISNCHCHWSHTKKCWMPQKGTMPSFASYLNRQMEFKKHMQAMDFENVEIIFTNGKFDLKMIPVPGCFIYLLVPPMQYFIRLRDDEIDSIKIIADYFQDLVLNYQN